MKLTHGELYEKANRYDDLLEKHSNLKLNLIQSQNNIENYRKVFSWMAQQEWFQNKRHLVSEYVSSFVHVDKRNKRDNA